VPLLGRQPELTHVCALLHRPEVRLLTLTGPGGSGKTRLAFAVADDLLEQRVVDEALLVDLSAIVDPSLVLSTIGDALGVRELPGQGLLDSVRLSLRHRRVLLLVDNFEQVLAAAPETLAPLLASCPDLKLLVTSREPVHLRWEQEFPLAPLRTPTLAPPPALDELAAIPSVSLFVDRAHAARPDFRLTAANAAAVAEICVRLDGLPLAIELAAAQVRLLSPESIRVRLDTPFDLLVGGPLDAPLRHRTLRQAIDWSVSLLPDAERALFRQLGVFAGGSSLRSIAVVAGEQAAQNGMSHLVQASLVTACDDGGERRFRLLDTLRAYALEQLTASDELAEARGRHAEHFLALAETAEPQLTGPDQQTWLGRLRGERDNLREAVRWLVDDVGGEAGLRITSALWRFWEGMGSATEGQRWLEAALDQGQDASLALRARALVRACSLARQRGEYARAEELGEASRSLREQIGDRRGVASSIQNVGLVAEQRGDLARASELYAASHAIFEALNDWRGVAASLNNIGNIACALGEFARATQLAERAREIYRRLGNTEALASSVANIGRAAGYMGDLALAEQLVSESLSVFQQLDNRPSIALQLANLSFVAFKRGLLELATDRAHQSLRIYGELGERSRDVAWVLQTLAAVELESGAIERAACWLSVSDGMTRALGVRRAALEEEAFASMRVRLVAALGATRLARIWANGRELPLREVVDLALAPVAPVEPVEPVEPLEDNVVRAGLTRREREVAGLVAHGLTNREIAEKLVISERTAEGHVERIRDKLGVRSRTQVARWAIENGLSE
jgi:predicted ATPase/DNA-binding CsgD family transcriptional regulator